MDLEDEAKDSLADSIPVKKRRKKRKTTATKLDENLSFFENLAKEGEAQVGELQEIGPPEKFSEDRPFVCWWVDDEVKKGDIEKSSWELRQDNHDDHVEWCRRLSRDPETGVCVEFSKQLLSEDMSEEIGTMLCVSINEDRASSAEKVGALALLKSVLADEPHLVSLGSPTDINICTWGKVEDRPRLLIDDGREPLDPTIGTDEEETDDITRYQPSFETFDPDKQMPAPVAVVCLDKVDGVEGLRKKTRESHLEYLERSGRVISAGPLFPVDSESSEPAPLGSLVFINAVDVNEALEFSSSDPYNEAGLFSSVSTFRYNKADVSGKHQATNIYDPDAIDAVSYKLQLESEMVEGAAGKYDEDKTPWLI